MRTTFVYLDFEGEDGDYAEFSYEVSGERYPVILDKSCISYDEENANKGDEVEIEIIEALAIAEGLV